jgi:hypothetical protein
MDGATVAISLIVKMCAGGGGAVTANNGTAGRNSSFGSWTTIAAVRLALNPEETVRPELSLYVQEQH